MAVLAAVAVVVVVVVVVVLVAVVILVAVGIVAVVILVAVGIVIVVHLIWFVVIAQVSVDDECFTFTDEPVVHLVFCRIPTLRHVLIRDHQSFGTSVSEFFLHPEPNTTQKITHKNV
ncbi:hypothetical protein NL108_016469 [Boleophthalmus pectinirostris]|nr:hypothetical protein NL108_016469 [Boleophthalmus pectinirostris]